MQNIKFKPTLIKKIVFSLCPHIPYLDQVNTSVQAEWYFHRVIEICKYHYDIIHLKEKHLNAFTKYCKEFAFNEQLLGLSEKIVRNYFLPPNLKLEHFKEWMAVDKLDYHEMDCIIDLVGNKQANKLYEQLFLVDTADRPVETNQQPPKRKKWDIPK